MVWFKVIDGASVDVGLDVEMIRVHACVPDAIYGERVFNAQPEAESSYFHGRNTDAATYVSLPEIARRATHEPFPNSTLIVSAEHYVLGCGSGSGYDFEVANKLFR